mgnify:CR=1 FL=1
MDSEKLAHRRAQNQASYRRHREVQLAKKREWRLANAARMRQLNAEWYQRNRDYALAAHKQYRETHREKCQALIAAWYQRNKEKVRRYRKGNLKKILAQQLYRRYGITAEAYKALLAAQGGRCAICRNLPGRKRLAVDHCHDTEQVRGLLCFNCNVLLGCSRDNVEVLQAAIAYLNQRGLPNV